MRADIRPISHGAGMSSRMVQESLFDQRSLLGFYDVDQLGGFECEPL